MYDIPDYVADPNSTTIDRDVAGSVQPVIVRSVAEYVTISKMDQNRTWGTDREVMVLAHMLKICIYVYTGGSDTLLPNWSVYDPSLLDLSIQIDVYGRALYLKLEDRHYEVVLSTLALTSHPSHKKEHKESVRSKGPSDDKNNPPQIYWENLRFHSVDQTWQEEKCHQLELPFSRHFGGRQGGPHVILTRPHQKGINSVAQYISETKMDRKGTWGTDRELDVAAHLLQMAIMVYD